MLGFRKILTASSSSVIAHSASAVPEHIPIRFSTGYKLDPVLVTKSALKNAVSVALTIMSADCVISNIRMDASN